MDRLLPAKRIIIHARLFNLRLFQVRVLRSAGFYQALAEVHREFRCRAYPGYREDDQKRDVVSLFQYVMCPYGSKENLVF